MIQGFAATNTTMELVHEIATRGDVIERQQEQIKTLQEQLQQTIKERDEAKAALEKPKEAVEPSPSADSAHGAAFELPSNATVPHGA
jgi:DNA repair exonuclease SbcCD ATPase subunit